MSAILAVILDFSKILFCAKPAARFTEIIRNNVFAEPNRNVIIIESKDKIRTNFIKKLVFYFKLKFA